MASLLRLAAARLRRIYNTPPKEVDIKGFVCTGAIVARGLIDKNGNITVAGDAGGPGYAAGLGLGGSVTQITDSTTGVTLNFATGKITTVALTTAAGAEEVFTVTDSAVGANDVVMVGTSYAGAGTPIVSTKKVVAGAFDIVITNLNASAALNAAVVINFAVIKGAVN